MKKSKLTEMLKSNDEDSPIANEPEFDEERTKHNAEVTLIKTGKLPD